jgi:hypothetical protein
MACVAAGALFGSETRFRSERNCRTSGTRHTAWPASRHCSVLPSQLAAPNSAPLVRFTHRRSAPLAHGFLARSLRRRGCLSDLPGAPEQRNRVAGLRPPPAPQLPLGALPVPHVPRAHRSRPHQAGRRRASCRRARGGLRGLCSTQRRAAASAASGGRRRGRCRPAAPGSSSRGNQAGRI